MNFLPSGDNILTMKNYFETDLSLDALCAHYLDITRQIESLEAEKERIKKEILESTQKKQASTEHYRVTKVKQLIITTTLESAKQLGCTMLKEQVDKTAIRKLFREGVTIPDVREIEWVMVKPLTRI